ncbi:hypothetical protein [Aureibacter tunicatorum]|uniref:thymidine phosphorylase n=1 Tax=Aureibacter tunicatorum TaxID=866807 RepID=A0AAE3XL50_9BACT|nr:hypothetical protein [Aureibacter tunicatorum]MDR6238862.1 pyrimidine-nucleoside phosphorylase [Aureibacter tunicatorum]BDD05211.1 pyrimidine-nucleoside phosphorylase [Aureibacter tunicatorum]
MKLSYSTIFNNIEKSIDLPDLLRMIFQNIEDLSSNKEQLLSSIIQILFKEESLKEEIKRSEELLNDTDITVSSFVEKALSVMSGDYVDDTILRKIYQKESLDEQEIESIVNMSLKPDQHSLDLTLILNFIKYRGLSADNVYVLSLKMAYSGDTFDYRNSDSLDSRKVIRRYPTGGVSEKIALIMPSLLKCFSEKYNLVSPFLVAKTLSFTGGTWDKLSSVPNFYFPKPGNETMEILEKHNVCMTVAKGSYNPSDTNLYQLRSITNTVNSLPLIVSSIASKQISNPVDTLMLDIRFGENAFLTNKELAVEFFDQISLILKKFNIEALAEYTNTDKIFGSGIGNCLEVMESICIMRNESGYGKFVYDESLLADQKELVVRMTAKLLSTQFGLDYEEMETMANEFFDKGHVYNAFREVLASHKVDGKTLDLIDNFELFGKMDALNKVPILADRDGEISEVYQRNIGNFLNIEMGAGTNVFGGDDKLYDGVLLKKKLFSKVRKNDVIAELYTESDVNPEGLSKRFFKIN